MLDFGFSEILLTSAIALVVLGPERLPKVARKVGNWMGRARAMARQLSDQLEREVNADELLKQQIRPKPAPLNSIAAPRAVPPDPHTPLPDAPTVAMPAASQAPATGHEEYNPPAAVPAPPHTLAPPPTHE